MRYFDRKLKIEMMDETRRVFFEFDEKYKITFQVEKTAHQGMYGFATATINIYNLNYQTRQNISNIGKFIRISAGYKDKNFQNFDQIFFGRLYNFINTKDDTETILKLYCSSMNELGFIVKESVERIPVSVFIRDIAGKAGIKNVIIDPMTAMISEATFNNSVFEILTDLANDYRLRISFEDNQLIVRSSDTKPIVPMNIPNLGIAEGLLGKPMFSIYNVALQTLMNPKMRVNNYFRLQSQWEDVNINNLNTIASISLQNQELLKGNPKAEMYNIYCIQSLRNSGDTHGEEWYTNVTANKLNPDGSMIGVADATRR